jgi:hypothetical protein
MINRYSLQGDFDYQKDDFVVDAELSDSGIWVKYEDIKDLFITESKSLTCADDIITMYDLNINPELIAKTIGRHFLFSDYREREFAQHIKEKVVDIVRKSLRERWFRLNNIKVLIPMQEIDDLCNDILQHTLEGDM